MGAALAEFDAALEIDPGDHYARFNRAATLALLGRADESLAEIEETIRRNPGFELAKRARERLLARR
jgi:lipoprotein NlpI